MIQFYFELDHGAESLECFDFLLHLGGGGAQLVEFFQAEQSISDGTLEQDIQRHGVEV